MLLRSWMTTATLLLIGTLSFGCMTAREAASNGLPTDAVAEAPGGTDNGGAAQDPGTVTVGGGDSVSVGGSGADGGGGLAGGGSGGATGGSSGTATAAKPIFPDSIAIDISDLPDEKEGGTPKSLSNAQSLDYFTYRRTILASTAIVNAFHRLADRSLLLANEITDDMASPDDSQVQGVLFDQGRQVLYKADFSPFDFDGDGAADGSGRVDTVPVAVRIWTDRGQGFERFKCALITSLPTDSHLGAGEMVTHPNAAIEEAADTLQWYVQWDRTGDTHRWNEAYITGRARDDYSVEKAVHRVDAALDANGVFEKTVRSNATFLQSPLSYDTYAFSALFRASAGLALLSAETTGDFQVSFSNICVDLLQQQVSEGACDDLDPTYMNFLPTPSGEETAFPADFPEQPTF